MTSEELNLDEGFMEPGDLDAFVRKAMFRDANFRVSRIGGTADDPKFTYHSLNFKGPNWFGMVRISVIGKQWRATPDNASAREMFSKATNNWYTVSVYVRRTDGPMFMAANDHREIIADYGRDLLYGKIKEVPEPESLYPYIAAALDEAESYWSQFYADGDDELAKVAIGLAVTITSYLKGANLLGEAIDPEDFMAPVLAQGGFRPLRWKLNQGSVSRGNDNWNQNQWSMSVGSFDGKVFGTILFEMDIGSPDDAKKNDGLASCEAQFGFSTGNLDAHRKRKSKHLWNVRKSRREGDSEMYWIPQVHSEAVGTITFRTKPELEEVIKKCFEICVKKDMRPLIDQRDDHGQPMLSQNEAALQKLFYNAFSHQNEARREAGVTESLDIYEAQFGPEDYEEFGQVATDIQYVSTWRKANGGINANRWIDVWAADLNCPLDQPNGKGITGYLSAYQGSEQPWLLRVNVTDGYSRGAHIVGYFKAEPSMGVLDKVREAVLRQIKAYVSGDDIPGNMLLVARTLAFAIQASIDGDPEVLVLNRPGSTNESLDIDVGEWVGDFLRYEGIGEWVKRETIANGLLTDYENSALDFEFYQVRGYVTFSAFEFTGEHLGYTQEIALKMNDYSADRSIQVSHASSANSWLKFRVPDDQFDAAKHALREFVADYIKPLAAKSSATGKPIAPNYKGAVSVKLLNTMAPWFVRNESLEINPEDIGKEFVAHGGAPLRWLRIAIKDADLWQLRFSWMDGSYSGVVGLLLQGEDTYEAAFTLYTMEDSVKREVTWYAEVVKLFNSKQMAQFQDRTIDWAKELMAVFGSHNPISRADSTYLYGSFSRAVHLADYSTESAMDPEEFIKGFDINRVMEPWERIDYDATPQNAWTARWRTRLEHRDKTRPFNDRLSVYIDYFEPVPVATSAHDPVNVLINGIYSYRGGPYVELKTIRAVYKGSGDEVVKIADNVIRSLVLPKITKNNSTPGGIKSFWRSLVTALRDAGAVVELSWQHSQDRPAIEEAITGLTFRSECRGAHHGQTDMTLYAELNGEAVGRIDYSVFNDEVFVQYIKTQPAVRRQGVATAMARQLQSEYPNTEIVWGGSTELGTPFIASLDREFEPEPQYGVLKKAYDDAKAEYAALQAEVVGWDGSEESRKSVLLKGERLNELSDLIWDLEDNLRDLKPGRWMIREALDPQEFYNGFTQATATTEWDGEDLNTSLEGGSRLIANDTGVLGPFGFNVYLRPSCRNVPETACSFLISCWATKSDGSFIQEAPDVWIRLSPTRGQPSFQPGNIDDFMTGLKEAVREFAPKVMPQKDISTTNAVMFNAMLAWMEKAGWQFDMDKNDRRVWNTANTGVGESLRETLEWSPDEIADLVKKSTECWGEWKLKPYNNEVSGEVAEDWTFHIQAPYGQLYKDNNSIVVRFYAHDPAKNYILGTLFAHFVAPYRSDYLNTTASNYDHIELTRQFTIPPDAKDEFRKSVESVFFNHIGSAVNKLPPKKFRLRDFNFAVKSGFTRLIRKWWVPGAVWI